VTVSGCAYFNGLYNANQLVKEAARAEREGRIGEARSLWSRAAVKAESVAVRYSDGKYFDDALLLQGRALRAAGRCRAAVAPLQSAIANSRNRTILEQAHFSLGRCLYADGQIDSAIVSFSRTVPSDDTLLASAAYLWRGRAYSNQGEYGRAIADYRASSLVDAAFDLAVAYARLHRRAEAEEVLRWRVDGEYIEGLWLATLDSVGDHLPDLSSDITDLLLERQDLSRSEIGYLLLRDGDRWAERAGGTRALMRFRQAVEISPDQPAGYEAQFRLIVAELQSSGDLKRLRGWSDSLAIIAENLDPSVSSVAEVAGVVETAARSLAVPRAERMREDNWRVQNPDLEMFLAAEALRDVTDAEEMAAALFKEIYARFPNSELAPKALLAAAGLVPHESDDLISTAQRRYPNSPYTLVLRGVALEAYAALEDSIRTLILAKRGAI
jgi:tetratricopeptide (TPR) repeat protein